MSATTPTITEREIETCPTCGEPKQRLIDVPLGKGSVGKRILVSVPCACERARQDAEAERRAREDEACRISKMKAECFRGSGRFSSCTFADDDHLTPETTTPCQRFAETFDPTEPYGLLLWGAFGTGKSFLSSCIANRVIERGYSAYQTDMRLVTNKFEESFEGRQAFLDKLLSKDLLLIEDLGAQRNSDYMLEQVFTVIDGRYKQGRPMVITTNLTLQTMSTADSSSPWGRIFDRVLEMCLPIEFVGGSRRRKRANDMRQTMAARLGIGTH